MLSRWSTSWKRIKVSLISDSSDTSARHQPKLQNHVAQCIF